MLECVCVCAYIDMSRRVLQLSADGSVYTTVGRFRPGPKDDGAFVSCRAHNKFFPAEALEDQWKIRVQCKSQCVLVGWLSASFNFRRLQLSGL